MISACAQEGVCYFVIPVISRINVSVNRDGVYPRDEHSSCPFCWLFRPLLCTDNSFHSTAFLYFCSQNGCSPGASNIVRKTFPLTGPCPGTLCYPLLAQHAVLPDLVILLWLCDLCENNMVV